MFRLAFKITCVISFLCLIGSEIYAQNRFVIRGTVPYDEVDVELGSVGSVNPKFSTLKTKAKNKEFLFSGSMDVEFERVYLKISKNDKRLKGWSFFIKSDEMKVDILSLDDKITKDDILYSNVPFIEEQKKYDSLIKPVSKNISYSHSLLQMWKNDKKNEHNLDSLAENVKSLKNEELRRKVKFIKDNSDAYLALYIFNREILNSAFVNINFEPDSLMSIYSIFCESLKVTDLGKSVYAYISKKQQLVINRVLPDFSFLTSTGENYNLSSFFQHKKYILLCFWDSYCLPCIKSFPLLKLLNETYGDKGLQMISVSIDANLEKWTSSLKRYDLPWLQTCNLPPYIKEQNVRSLYDINYIPQYFLLNNDGKLIYHNTQLKDGDAYSILQKLLENLIP